MFAADLYRLIRKIVSLMIWRQQLFHYFQATQRTARCGLFWRHLLDPLLGSVSNSVSSCPPCIAACADAAGDVLYDAAGIDILSDFGGDGAILGELS